MNPLRGILLKIISVSIFVLMASRIKAAAVHVPPEVTALGYAAPVLTVTFAMMFLGEPVRAFRLSVVALGLVGVVIILSPRLTVLSIDTADKMEAVGTLLMLMRVVFMALVQVFVRRLVGTESTAAIVFYFSINATLLSLLTIPFGWVIPT